MTTPASRTLEKGLSFLALLVTDGAHSSLADLARAAGLPQSTAYRLLVTLQRHGFVARGERGRYLPGPAIMRLGRSNDLNGVLSRVARPLLEGLARRSGLTAHLGVLEGDMVTYLVKAEGDTPVLTREGMQLEGYCTAIGKILLAALPEHEVDRYLDDGPFIRLTSKTIIEPEAIRCALTRVRETDLAVDDAETDIGLRCIAAPIRADDGRVCAAISLSAPAHYPIESYKPDLRTAAGEIESRLARGPF